MSISRRSFLRNSVAAAAAVPFLEHVSIDYCHAAETGTIDLVDFRLGFPPGAVRLNRNENPFGPSPMAIEAVKQGLSEANRYVIPPTQLRKALADLHDVDEKMVRMGTGSGEILSAVALAYLKDGGNMVSTLETFRTTPMTAEKIGAKVKWIKLKPDWSYDVERLLGAVDSETKLFYMVNPNNPTGTTLGYDDLKSIADALPKDVLFFIDEAYVHFLPDDKNGVDLLKSGHDNVFVTRTFSKVYGLAGLRVGYGVGHPDVVNKVAKYMFTQMNTAGFGGAIAALHDHDHVKKFLAHAKTCKGFYEKELSALGLKYIIGSSPLLMVEVGEDSKAFVDKMAKENVFTRKGEDWDMPTHIRISYGLDDQNKAAIAALKKLLT
jgi:histidinol-phosphate aminotransferase